MFDGIKTVEKGFKFHRYPNNVFQTFPKKDIDYSCLTFSKLILLNHRQFCENIESSAQNNKEKVSVCLVPFVDIRLKPIINLNLLQYFCCLHFPVPKATLTANKQARCINPRPGLGSLHILIWTKISKPTVGSLFKLRASNLATGLLPASSLHGQICMY